MLTRLYLIRHGRVDSAWRDRVYGCLDVPLSSEGEQQAREAARRLRGAPLDAIISSGLARANWGARQIAHGRSCPEHVDPGLREIDRGAWAGQTKADLSAADASAWLDWMRAPADLRPPNGESLGDVSRRVLPRLDVWANAHAGGAVACVAHLWVLRVAVCAALGLNLDQAPMLDVQTGGIVVIDWPLTDTKDGGGDASERPLRPTLVGFGIDAIPAGRAWFRGPHRDASRGSAPPESKSDENA